MNVVTQDQNFLTALGFDAGGEAPWRLLGRSGHVLLVLPDQKRAIRRGIRLYQPQRFLARCLVVVVTAIPFGSLLLSSWTAGLKPEGALQRICTETKSRIVSVLLGNPSQRERRAVLLLEDDRNCCLIVKIGTSLEACGKIREECLFLENHGGVIEGIPSLRGRWRGKDWEAFAIDYCDGQGPATPAGVCAILKPWMQDEFFTPMEDHPEIRTIAEWMLEHGETQSLVDEWKVLSLRKTIRHGDFAPWNVLAGRDGGSLVIDWEFGKNGSIPGWDLVHYFYLSATLVDRLSPPDALTKVRSLLENEEPCREYLSGAGWSGRVGLLLKTYFYSMKGQLDSYDKLAQSVSVTQ